MCMDNIIQNKYRKYLRVQRGFRVLLGLLGFCDCLDGLLGRLLGFFGLLTAQRALVCRTRGLELGLGSLERGFSGIQAHRVGRLAHLGRPMNPSRLVQRRVGPLHLAVRPVDCPGSAGPCAALVTSDK